MSFRLDGARDHYRANGQRLKMVLTAQRAVTDDVVRADKASGRTFASPVRTAPTSWAKVATLGSQHILGSRDLSIEAPLDYAIHLKSPETLQQRL